MNFRPAGQSPSCRGVTLSAKEATIGFGVIFDSQSGVVSPHEMHAFMKSVFRYLRLADIMTVISQLFVPDANAKFELNFFEKGFQKVEPPFHYFDVRLLTELSHTTNSGFFDDIGLDFDCFLEKLSIFQIVFYC